MKLHALPTAIGLIGLWSFVASAVEPDPLDNVVVTAARTAQTIDETLAPVTVITREDIERAQVGTLPDLLRSQVGVSLSNNGGPGKVSELRLRGANADQVLVLVDGVAIGSASSGTASFQDLPLELIDRIEIVRGPRSSLYGSEAMGGVIQIFTRKGGPTRLTAAAGIGSYGTTESAATAAGSFGDGGWGSAGFERFDTRGFPACKGDLNSGCFTLLTPPVGYRDLAARAEVGWRFDQDTQVSLNWLGGSGHNAYNGSFANSALNRQQVIGLNAETRLVQGWQTRLIAGKADDYADDYLDGVYVDTFNTERRSLNWQNEVQLAAGQKLTGGVDWQIDHVDSSVGFVPNSRQTHGVYAQYLGTFGAQNLELALRQDHNEQFGEAGTGSVAWGYAISTQLRVTASYGTAFKAPTFNDLFYPGFGNPGLHPERSRSGDLGLSGKFDDARWSINAFLTEFNDLIALDANFVPQNIDTALVRGLEFTWKQTLRDWQLAGSLTLLDPRNEGTQAGKVLPRRARQAMNVSVDRDLGIWRLGTLWRTEDRRYDDVANTQVLAGYGVVDVHGELHFAPAWRLQLRLENSFNRDYETAYRYNQPGRGVYATLRYAS